MIDLKSRTLKELDELEAAIPKEKRRRAILATAKNDVEAIERRVLEAEGNGEGAAWRPPSGAHNAYPKGWTVSRNGKAWKSLIASNPHEPGVSGWREVTADGSPPPFETPSGSADDYNVGDRVTFEGAVYESTIDGNVWSPSEHPAGWTAL